MFVSNRTRKIAEVTKEVGINWKYCPSADNLADLGSRGASIDKMEKSNWFAGPEWLLDPQSWPKQPILEKTKSVLDEQKPVLEAAFNVEEKAPDEWDCLLSRSSYWKTVRVTGWALRFVTNAKAKKRKDKVTRSPLTTKELEESRTIWVKKVQINIKVELRTPGREVKRDGESGLLVCEG